MTALLAARSMAELAEDLRWKIDQALDEVTRMVEPGETLPGMTRRPTRAQVAKYVAVQEKKVEAWREVLAAMGQET